MLTLSRQNVKIFGLVVFIICINDLCKLYGMTHYSLAHSLWNVALHGVKTVLSVSFLYSMLQVCILPHCVALLDIIQCFWPSLHCIMRCMHVAEIWALNLIWGPVGKTNVTEIMPYLAKNRVVHNYVIFDMFIYFWILYCVYGCFLYLYCVCVMCMCPMHRICRSMYYASFGSYKNQVSDTKGSWWSCTV